MAIPQAGSTAISWLFYRRHCNLLLFYRWHCNLLVVTQANAVTSWLFHGRHCNLLDCSVGRRCYLLGCSVERRCKLSLRLNSCFLCAPFFSLPPFFLSDVTSFVFALHLVFCCFQEGFARIKPFVSRETIHLECNVALTKLYAFFCSNL